MTPKLRTSVDTAVEDCQAVCLWLNKKGVFAGQWWAGFYRAFDWTELSEAGYLKEHVLTIRSHQQLSRRNIDHISFLFKKRAESADMEWR